MEHDKTDPALAHSIQDEQLQKYRTAHSQRVMTAAGINPGAVWGVRSQRRLRRFQGRILWDSLRGRLHLAKTICRPFRTIRQCCTRR
jgi:hypothetical protein